MAGATARRPVVVWGAFAVLATLAGCAKDPPPPPPPTVVTVNISAGPDANPNPAGQGAPVVIRVYQLSSSAGFEKAEFFRLYNGDTTTLGADLVKKDEFLLPPGSTKSMRVEPAPNVTTIGVFAAYRDFSKVNWRGVVDVPAHKTTAITVDATASGITVAGKPGS